MNMQSIIKMSQNTKTTIASIQEQEALEAEKEKQERLERKIEAIAYKAKRLVEANDSVAPAWMKKEAAQLEADIITFFKNGEGQPLTDFLDEGCGVFFGKNGMEAIAVKNFGTYVLSLENARTGSRYPKVLVINVRAQFKLASLLKGKLGIENVSLFGVNQMLEEEKFGKLPVEFVPVEKIPEENEIIPLGKTTEIIGKDTPVEVHIVAAVVNDKALVTRTDWYDGCGQVPEKENFVFSLRYVGR